MPKRLALSGRYSKKYFDRNGNLRRIKGFTFWPIKSVLMEKYKFKENEAQALNDFLLPMLRYFPDERCTAQEALRNPWLNMPDNFDYQMNEREYQSMIMINKNKNEKKEKKKGKRNIKDIRIRYH